MRRYALYRVPVLVIIVCLYLGWLGEPCKTIPMCLDCWSRHEWQIKKPWAHKFKTDKANKIRAITQMDRIKTSIVWTRWLLSDLLFCFLVQRLRPQGAGATGPGRRRGQEAVGAQRLHGRAGLTHDGRGGGACLHGRMYHHDMLVLFHGFNGHCINNYFTCSGSFNDLLPTLCTI